MITIQTSEFSGIQNIITHVYDNLLGDINKRRYAAFQLIDPVYGMSVTDGGTSNLDRTISYNIPAGYFEQLKEMLVVGDCVLTEFGYAWRGLLVGAAYISGETCRLDFVPSSDLFNPVRVTPSNEIAIDETLYISNDIAVGEN